MNILIKFCFFVLFLFLLLLCYTHPIDEPGAEGGQYHVELNFNRTVKHRQSSLIFKSYVKRKPLILTSSHTLSKWEIENRKFAFFLVIFLVYAQFSLFISKIRTNWKIPVEYFPSERRNRPRTRRPQRRRRRRRPCGRLHIYLRRLQ